MTRRNITKKENFQAEGRMIFKENGLDLNEKWVWVDNQAPTELLGAGHLFFPSCTSFTRGYLYYTPFGVIGFIALWHFQFLMTIIYFSPAPQNKI